MKNSKNVLLLLAAAILWGFAFTAQKSGMDHVSPVAFNCIRSFIGAIVLVPCVFLFKHLKSPAQRAKDTLVPRRFILFAGACCGLVLAAATTTQQIGIKYTDAGKAGFITACYIILVPIFGLFLKKSCSWLLWTAVALAVLSLYLLCMTSTDFSVNKGDLFTLLCALLFAGHILVIDFFVLTVDGVLLSCLQFFVCGLVLLPVLLCEGLPAWSAVCDCALPLLYAGIMSCGVAYTCQIVGQKNFNPTIASLIMSLESTFAVLGAAIVLEERLTPRQYWGCAVMFVAIILAQIPLPRKKLL